MLGGIQRPAGHFVAQFLVTRALFTALLAFGVPCATKPKTNFHHRLPGPIKKTMTERTWPR